MKAKPLAKSKAIWKVGNGDNILFWQDNWTCQGPLINHPSFGKWAELCIERYGLKFSDYRSGNGWLILSVLSLDLIPLMILLKAINNSRDTLIWGDSSSGLYSIASGYFSIWERMEKPIWANA